jgi:hypothetical protein
MIIFGSYMFEINVSRDMKNNNNNNDIRRILAYLPAYLPTLVVKKLKISVEKGRVAKTLSIIKH